MRALASSARWRRPAGGEGVTAGQEVEVRLWGRKCGGSQARRWPSAGRRDGRPAEAASCREIQGWLRHRQRRGGEATASRSAQASASARPSATPQPYSRSASVTSSGSPQAAARSAAVFLARRIGPLAIRAIGRPRSSSARRVACWRLRSVRWCGRSRFGGHPQQVGCALAVAREMILTARVPRASRRAASAGHRCCAHSSRAGTRPARPRPCAAPSAPACPAARRTPSAARRSRRMSGRG